MIKRLESEFGAMRASYREAIAEAQRARARLSVQDKMMADRDHEIARLRQDASGKAAKDAKREHAEQLTQKQAELDHAHAQLEALHGKCVALEKRLREAQNDHYAQVSAEVREKQAL